VFVEITNEPRDYAWGSTTLMAEFLGRAPSGAPEAELWLGTHPGSPARVVGRNGDLRDVAGELPFLLKVLAAGSTLSLQAHPTPEQAREGFAREDAEGIPRDDPSRNYKDPYAKPEMVYALTEFRALSGFRPVPTIRTDLDSAAPGLLPDLRAEADLRSVVERLLTTDVSAELDAIVAASADGAGESWATVRDLAAQCPGDPGIAISLLLHTVVLRPGEALYLPAGNIHAYQRGLAIELMGPSDNVLRGGLTPKHVDVPELLGVLDFRALPEPRVEPLVSAGVRDFSPEGAGFRLRVLERGATVEAEAPAVVLVLEGDATVGDVILGAGRAGVIVDEAAPVRASGSVVVATTA
jgi:mannose-6-phosphate isomerase, class I